MHLGGFITSYSVRRIRRIFGLDCHGIFDVVRGRKSDLLPYRQMPFMSRASD